MKRIEQIRMHPLYQEAMQGISRLEQERMFCKHGMEHCLDVARILYIMVLERGLSYDKEVVYATALLHDIGRYEEYTKKISHHEVGERIAGEILFDCSFSEEERNLILDAIRGHKEFDETAGAFCQLLYQADKLSRSCYSCKAQRECYWEDNRKNREIQY